MLPIEERDLSAMTPSAFARIQSSPAAPPATFLGPQITGIRPIGFDVLCIPGKGCPRPGRAGPPNSGPRRKPSPGFCGAARIGAVLAKGMRLSRSFASGWRNGARKELLFAIENTVFLRETRRTQQDCQQDRRQKCVMSFPSVFDSFAFRLHSLPESQCHGAECPGSIAHRRCACAVALRVRVQRR